MTCEKPEGAVLNGSDCDDEQAAVYPGAPEICLDGLINDCDDTDGWAAAAACPPDGPYRVAFADGRLLGEAEGDVVGRVLASAGDVDGDGHDDLLVGAPEADVTSSGLEGAAWLVLGPVSGTEMLSDADARLDGDDFAAAGTSLASAGDMDGDGFGDFMIGAPSDSADGTWAGTAYLIYGPVTGTHKLADETHRLDLSGTWDFLGSSVANAGDTDGDGITDLLVGAYRDDDGGTDAGAAWLLLGGGSLVSGGS